MKLDMKFQHLSQITFWDESYFRWRNHTKETNAKIFKNESINIYTKWTCRSSSILTDLENLHIFAKYCQKCLCMSLMSIQSRFRVYLCSLCIALIKWFLYQIMLPGCPFLIIFYKISIRSQCISILFTLLC